MNWMSSEVRRATKLRDVFPEMVNVSAIPKVYKGLRRTRRSLKIDFDMSQKIGRFLDVG